MSKQVVSEDSLVSIFLDLIDDLKIVFYTSSELIDLELISVIIKDTDKLELSKTLTTTILAFKNQIESRDRKAFMSLNITTDSVWKEKINYFLVKLCTQNFLEEEYEDALWQYLKKILEMSVIYKKNK